MSVYPSVSPSVSEDHYPEMLAHLKTLFILRPDLCLIQFKRILNYYTNPLVAALIYDYIILKNTAI